MQQAFNKLFRFCTRGKLTASIGAMFSSSCATSLALREVFFEPSVAWTMKKKIEITGEHHKNKLVSFFNIIQIFLLESGYTQFVVCLDIGYWWCGRSLVLVCSGWNCFNGKFTSTPVNALTFAIAAATVALFAVIWNYCWSSNSHLSSNWPVNKST